MLRYFLIAFSLMAVFGARDALAAKGKILMIIAPEDFRDEELLVPKRIFEEAGYDVVIASRERRECRGMLGAVVMPDITIGQVDPEEYVAVVMVGGVGAREYFDDAYVQDLLNRFYDMGKVVSAICLAPVTLARAGLLEGKKATVWRSEGKSLEKAGALYTGEAVAQDGRLITGAGPFAAEEFARSILHELERQDRR